MINGAKLVYKPDEISKPYHDEAVSRSFLYQYTNFNSFLHIAMERTLLFNRIDNMNDVQEAELFKNEEGAKLVYLSCFSTQQKESIPMWNIYTQKDDGLRLKIEVDEDNILSTIIDTTRDITTLDNKTIGSMKYHSGEFDIKDWIAEFSQTDVFYTDIRIIEDTFISDNSFYYLNHMGLVKDNSWSYEKESRMILKLRTAEDSIEAPNYPGFLVPIDLRKMKKFEITFSPWMDDVKKICVRDIVEKYLPGVNAKYKDSEFTKKIVRK